MRGERKLTGPGLRYPDGLTVWYSNIVNRIVMWYFEQTGGAGRAGRGEVRWCGVGRGVPSPASWIITLPVLPPPEGEAEGRQWRAADTGESSFHPTPASVVVVVVAWRPDTGRSVYGSKEVTRIIIHQTFV
ncbi:hypothetical protein E2C01_036520 [Portunus trituberculatus]|uniref:Uncharacterized protein n=1 Tax=Portunus trituberculatus TaxID=210409 RepID=A0A5B7FCA3_PORTR|nr:hypothetical protein [Portunus trituberculatus]